MSESGNQLPFSNQDLSRLFLPLVVEQFLEFSVGLISSIMVASVGEAAVSGVSLVDFIMMLMINIFTALATGGAVVAGQYLGRKDSGSAQKTAVQLILLNGFVAILVMLFLYAIKGYVLHWIFGRVDENVMEHARTYLLYVAASIPFMAVYIAGAAIFRTMGNSLVSMKVAAFMNVVNIAGCALFLFGLHWGTAGVGLAALVSRAIAAILILGLLTNAKLALHIGTGTQWSLEWSTIRKILGIGVPFGLENSVFYLGRLLVLSLVATFGTAAIAANAVGGTIVMFQVLPGMAINLGVTAVISRCVGSNDFTLAKFYHKKILRIIFLAQIAMNLVIWALLPWILRLYGLSELTASLTRQIVFAHGIVSILIWPIAYTLPVTFRAAGDARYPMAVGIVTMFGCRVLMAHVLASTFHLGLMGTWFAMFLDWIVRAVMFTVRYFNGRWMRYQVL